jgi:twitching motility protein PilT
MMSAMDLAALIHEAALHGASDLHLEPGYPPTVRVLGHLESSGPACEPVALEQVAHRLIGTADWPAFLERRSADLSRVLAGRRCRINLLHSIRGIGLAVRLLADAAVTIRSLNLHPSLDQLVAPHHGLVLICGPTGSGKSSTLAALLQQLNTHEARHLVTVEQPVEYLLKPKKCFIRQREVGRDTPDFSRAIYDSMREDIDVLMVGEMRDRDVMRLTLDACETGHLVLTTIHASNTTEALQRIVSAFPAVEQPSVCSQLANSIVAVVAQRLQYREDLGLRVPQCEILRGSTGVRSIIRQGQLFKLQTALETGRAEGMWTFDRYEDWMDARTDWVMPAERGRMGRPLDFSAAGLASGAATGSAAEPVDRETVDIDHHRTGEPQGDDPHGHPPASRITGEDPDDVIVIQPDDGDMKDILTDLERSSGEDPAR